MKRHALLIAALATGALLNLPASAKTLERHYQKSFDVQPGASLVLSHGDGDVTIEPWTENRIDIKVDYVRRTTGIFTTVTEFSVDFEQKGNQVRVTEHAGGHGGIIVNSRRSVYTYIIKAPAWVEILSDGDDGNFKISGWRAKLDMTLDDGDMQLSDINAPSISIRMQDGHATLDGITGALTISCDDGEIDVASAKVSPGSINFEDGDCTITGSEGDLRVRMDDGNFTLLDARCRHLDVHGMDGSAKVELLSVDNPDLSISMDDGSASLAIPDDLSAEFSAEAEDGSVTVKLVGAKNVEKGRRSVRGVLRDGKGQIRMETVDGSVTLRQVPK